MKDSVFNAIQVVADSTAALALSAGELFLFGDTPSGGVPNLINSQQPVNFFEKKRPDGNRITYFRRTPIIPNSTGQDALGYVRVFNIIECDPLGVYPIICGSGIGSYAPNDVGGVHTNEITLPPDLDWRTGSLPEFISPPPSASQCACP